MELNIIKINTPEEVKRNCIKELKKLIKDIKNDKTSDNYTFSVKLIHQTQDSIGTTTDVEYTLSRTEYISRKNEL